MKKTELKEDDFVVNDFTTINKFVELDEFKTFIKFGEPYEYQKFNGELKGKKVTGWLCLADNNIYGLTQR